MLESGLPDIIDGNESIARFLFNEGEHSKSLVKGRAFSPHTESRETSVSRHGIEPADDFKKLGEEVAQKRKRSLRGVAMIQATDIQQTGLQLEADEPPQRHAAIRGWPWNDDVDMRKALHLHYLNQLAEKSDLILYI